MEVVLKKGIGGSVSVHHFDNETIASADQLTNVQCKVFTQDGAQLIATSDVTPDGDGLMTVCVHADEAGVCRDWCRAHFQYDYNENTFSQDVCFHIASDWFDIPLHWPDLVQYEPELQNYSWDSDPHYAGQRRTALEELYDRLASAGFEPWKIANKSQFKSTFAFLWLSHALRALSDSNSAFWERSEFYRQQFERAFSKINIATADSPDAPSGCPKPIGLSRIVRG